MPKILVKVKPNSQQPKIIEAENGSLTVYVKSPPVDGKANQELIKLLANKYQVSKSQIMITYGMTSKTKLIEII